MSGQRAEERRGAGSEVAMLCALLAVAAIVGLLLVGGALSGFLFGGGWAWPSSDVIRTLGRIFMNAGEPATAYPPTETGKIPGPIPFWGTIGGSLMVLVFLGTLIAVKIAAGRSRTGMLSRTQAKRVMKRLDSPLLPFATYLGVRMRNRVEDATIVVAPQQMGKTTRVATGRVIDAPGGVLVTSTKADLLAATFYLRHQPQDDRLAYVMDFDDVSGLPDKLKWDLVAGCEDPEEAILRAAAMVGGRPIAEGSASNQGFFEGKAITVLQCLLHAAALDGRNARSVLHWARVVGDNTPFEILSTHPNASPGWAEDLREETRGEARPTIESTMKTLKLALSCLSLPRVVDLVCPERGEGFDIDAFVERNRDTLYVLSEGKATTSTGPLASAFTAVVAESALRKGRRRKLPTPFTLVLDEAANIAVIPDMDKLLTDGGGRGVNSWVFFQAIPQMRERWGRERAETIWAGTSMKLLLPGIRSQELREIAQGLGDKIVRDKSFNNPGLFANSGGSTSDSIRTELIMAADEITHMRDGEALLLWKNVAPAVVKIPGHWERKDHKAVRASIDQVTAMQQEAERDAELIAEEARRWRSWGAVVVDGRGGNEQIPTTDLLLADGRPFPTTTAEAADLEGVALVLSVRQYTVAPDAEATPYVEARPVVVDPSRYGYRFRGTSESNGGKGLVIS